MAGTAKIFEYAVILHPEKDEKGKDIGTAEVIVELTSTLAKDDNQVAMLAARAIPEEHEDKLDRIEIAIRPF